MSKQKDLGAFWFFCIPIWLKLSYDFSHQNFSLCSSSKLCLLHFNQVASQVLMPYENLQGTLYYISHLSLTFAFLLAQTLQHYVPLTVWQLLKNLPFNCILWLFVSWNCLPWCSRSSPVKCSVAPRTWFHTKFTEVLALLLKILPFEINLLFCLFLFVHDEMIL